MVEVEKGSETVLVDSLSVNVFIVVVTGVWVDSVEWKPVVTRLDSVEISKFVDDSGEELASEV